MGKLSSSTSITGVGFKTKFKSRKCETLVLQNCCFCPLDFNKLCLPVFVGEFNKLSFVFYLIFLFSFVVLFIHAVYFRFVVLCICNLRA